MNNIKVMIALLMLLASANTFAQTCTYNTYKWNTQMRKAVDFRQVSKPYNEVQDGERDALTGCTVCSEDQRAVSLPGLPGFKICKLFAGQLEEMLTALLKQGAAIKTITGYRVGMTRGEVDIDGNRTQFSNHSFGIALDINTEHNGLYDQCLQFGENCRLIRGGPWRPGEDQYSLTAENIIVQAMKQLGFRWGGEISGKQKDFMHFSPTGY